MVKELLFKATATKKKLIFCLYILLDVVIILNVIYERIILINSFLKKNRKPKRMYIIFNVVSIKVILVQLNLFNVCCT